MREFRRVPIVPMPFGAPLFIFYLVKAAYKKCRRCNAVENYDEECKFGKMPFLLWLPLSFIYT